MAVVCVGISCATAPVTGRRQLITVSSGEEMQLGLSSFDQLKKETPISKDPAANALVQKVGKRISEAAAKDLPNAQWEFVVFESKEANAFCLPGGKVGIYTGILPITKDEAGLATVMGHEVAHAAARHGAERMSQAKLEQQGETIVNAIASKSESKIAPLAAAAFPALANVAVLLPYSRSQESEADHIGLNYMARAGYDPAASVEFWKRFSAFNAQNGGKATPTLLRTHPVDEVRIKQLQDWLPEAKAVYKPQ